MASAKDETSNGGNNSGQELDSTKNATDIYI